MTQVGAGGVVIRAWAASRRYQRDYRKLTPELQERVRTKLRDMKKNPRPAGLRFEKLNGYDNPPVYTIHVTGNYKLSLELDGDRAFLRRVGSHDTIDRQP